MGAAGVYALAAAQVGMVLPGNRAQAWLRTALLAAAFTLLWPGLVTDLVGLGLLAAAHVVALRWPARMAEKREGISFCLSLPLDFPGGSALNDRRAPPRTFATLRDGEVNYDFPLARRNPKLTDVICDDAFCCTPSTARNGTPLCMSAHCSTRTATAGPRPSTTTAGAATGT